MKLIIKMFAVAGVFVLLSSIDSVGVSVDKFWPTAVIAAILLGVLSLVIKPIVSFFSFPITILTLGLFTFVINALIFWMLGFLDGVTIDGFVAALIGSLFVTVTVWLVDFFLD